MIKISRKLTLAATVFAMTLAASASYADDDHKGREDRDDGEYVAITLKTDPVNDDHEAACVALQLGMNLLSESVPDEENDSTPVEPAEKVVLFPTLGGVELINPMSDLMTFWCTVPDGFGGFTKAPLAMVLANYDSMGGEIIVCPLCAKERGIDVPSYGTMGSGVSIHELFIDADKVIGF